MLNRWGGREMSLRVKELAGDKEEISGSNNKLENV